MHHSVRDASIRLNEPLEGRGHFMYLGIKKPVSTGVGNLLYADDPNHPEICAHVAQDRRGPLDTRGGERAASGDAARVRRQPASLRTLPTARDQPLPRVFPKGLEPTCDRVEKEVSVPSSAASHPLKAAYLVL